MNPGGGVTEVLVLCLKESADHYIESEEVEDWEDHWANGFRSHFYTVAELRDLIVADQKARRGAVSS